MRRFPFLLEANKDNGGAPPATPPAPPEPTPDKDNDITSLPDHWQAYIKSLRKEAAENRTEAKAAKTAAQLAEEARLKESGQWQTLAEQRAADLERLKPEADAAERLRKVISDSNAQQIAKIPERYRAAVPTSYPPEMLAAWLTQNLALFTLPAPPNLNPGAGGPPPSPDGSALTDEERAIAKKMGVSEADYAKNKI